MKLHLTDYTNEQVNLPCTPMGTPIITPILQIRKQEARHRLSNSPRGWCRLSDAVGFEYSLEAIALHTSHPVEDKATKLRNPS